MTGRWAAVVCGVGAFAGVACSRPDRAPADSTPDTVEVSATGADWVSELGEVLLVHGDSDQVGILLAPDVPAARHIAATPLAFVRAAGDSATAGRIALAAPDSQACGEAPVARLSRPGPAGWTVGLSAGPVAQRVDSIETFSAADSAAAVVTIARLASAIPVDRDSKFNGLPFVVMGAYRLRDGANTILVARVARRIPQEASPLEERTLVVAERSGDGYKTQYHLRSEGPEDSVEHYALLSAVRVADKLFFLVERESDLGSRYEIIERSANGSWRLRWARLLAC